MNKETEKEGKELKLKEKVRIEIGEAPPSVGADITLTVYKYGRQKHQVGIQSQDPTRLPNQVAIIVRELFYEFFFGATAPKIEKKQMKDELFTFADKDPIYIVTEETIRKIMDNKNYNLTSENYYGVTIYSFLNKETEKITKLITQPIL